MDSISTESAVIRAWALMLECHDRFVKHLDRVLATAKVISLEQYDILLHLEEAENQRLRMSELADRAFLSRSGITRAVDRLADQGYIRRVACPHDRRAIHAEITKEGLAARKAAWKYYRTAILNSFGCDLPKEEAVALADQFLALQRRNPQIFPRSFIAA
jgi:DNA-binding MarR family transcriptional regulator